MFYEPRQRDRALLPHDPIKAIVTPRPIGWISTKARDGRINLAPYSFFNAFSSSPCIVGFSSEGMKDSASFAIESGEFVANLASFDLFHKISETSAPLPRGTSEFDYAGLTMAESRLVRPPRVAEAHAALECKVVELVQLRNRHGDPLDNHLVLGEVIGVHIEDGYIKDGRFDTAKAQPLARLGYQDYAYVETLVTLARPKGGGDGQ
jgi:flavin reductase (DIM6/NTAB) family NADH-FMN oxidoreductase RutF